MSANLSHRRLLVGLALLGILPCVGLFWPDAPRVDEQPFVDSLPQVQAPQEDLAVDSEVVSSVEPVTTIAHEPAAPEETQEPLSAMMEHLGTALSAEPCWPQVLRSVAWVLATHDDPRIRDDKLALRLAEEACWRTNFRVPELLDALAAAYAEAGLHLEAERVQGDALRLGGSETLVREARQQRLELYAEGQAFHQPARFGFVPRTQDETSIGKERAAYVMHLAAESLDVDSVALPGLRQAVVQLDPEFRPGQLAMAQVYWSAGVPDPAAVCLEAALDLDRDDPVALADLGTIRKQQQRIGEAISLYEEALRHRPDWPQVANSLAWLLATHHDAALRDAERAIELAEGLIRREDPPSPRHLDTLCVAYAAAGRQEDAIRTAERGKNLHAGERWEQSFQRRLELFALGVSYGGDPQEHLDAGARLLKQGQLQQASERYLAALAVDEHSTHALADLGTIRKLQGRDEESLTFYLQALAQRPDLLTVANSVAWMLATHESDALRQPQAAVRLAEQICQETEHRQLRYLDTLAVCYAAAGDFQRAQQTVRTAFSLLAEEADPDWQAKFDFRQQLFAANLPYRSHSQAVRDLAHHHWQAGRLSEAERLLSKLHQSGHPSAETLADLGTLCKLQGRAAEAVSYYERALAQRPTWPQVANALAWLLATHENADVRNGNRALELARELEDATTDPSPRYLDTLAAAHAELGQFELATETLSRAMRLLTPVDAPPPADAETWRERFQARAVQFDQRQPVRD